MKMKEDEDPMAALNRGFYVTSALVAIALFVLCRWLLRTPTAPPDAWLSFFFCGLVGLATEIEDDGALLVRAGGAQHRVTVGDVVHLRTT